MGLPPGGGALEWLPRVVGRSRALEIALSGDDFDADIAERYGWVNRTLNEDELNSFVDTLASRLATFDREALAAVKTQINRVGVPTAAELEFEQQAVFCRASLARCQKATGKGSWHRLRHAQRLRIEFWPIPPLDGSLHSLMPIAKDLNLKVLPLPRWYQDARQRVAERHQQVRFRRCAKRDRSRAVAVVCST